MSVFSTPRLHAFLGALVLTIGAGLAWDTLMRPALLLVFIATIVFLFVKGRSIGLIWAWSTLLLGVECLAWPIITMLRIRSVTDQPSDEQMGLILTAVLMGLFSSVFWISFSYGLFKRSRVVETGPESETAASRNSGHRQRPKNK